MRNVEAVNQTPPVTTLNVPMTVEEALYLLSKLEIAQTALEKIAFLTFGRDEPFSGSAYNLADQALKQIKEPG